VSEEQRAITHGDVKHLALRCRAFQATLESTDPARVWFLRSANVLESVAARDQAMSSAELGQFARAYFRLEDALKVLEP
jgi:hypothetical protein